jgi:hypothetical protein
MSKQLGSLFNTLSLASTGPTLKMHQSKTNKQKKQMLPAVNYPVQGNVITSLAA